MQVRVQLLTEFTINEGSVSVNGAEVKTLDRLDYTSPVKFVIKSNDGVEFTYIVSISYSSLPVVYINTKVCEYSVQPSSNPVEEELPIKHDLYLLHGVGSRNDDVASVIERAKIKMGEIRKLCEKYKRQSGGEE